MEADYLVGSLKGGACKGSICGGLRVAPRIASYGVHKTKSKDFLPLASPVPKKKEEKKKRKEAHYFHIN
jgi:hypothetical protein